ncbi:MULTISPECIES: hypothetical protein [unclassified Massilia]|uniref:hypothetical protein n=1 Tax=unclassified Massilia TaxID=2609279 RepID=UPI00067A9C04|nr:MULTISPECIES: hypothetical protein [unclassified Massilia]AKU22596.1 hypothetical protein ACZ75_15035 [Massilia sp. NR 4-1]NVE00838.1 hypothetical protein [Massilia sp. BJB1822]UMR32619.1 hypothetical protein MJ904_10895 [Massilia sp. MB5]UTY56456.1 hypothetical protein HPQ68_04165 [Massilia sp. erpn]
MNIASLKVYGDETTVADVRDGLPSEPESDWKKGDVRPDGRVRIDDGFYVNLGEESNPDTLMRQIRAYLHECEARGITFDVASIAAELRIAFTVAEPEQGAYSLDFTLADLSLLTEMGITLSITS